MGQPRGIGAHDQHDPGRILALRLHHRPESLFGIPGGIPVQIQHQTNRGILLQNRLNGLPGVVVGAVVGGVVVELPVVDFESALLLHLLMSLHHSPALTPHIYHLATTPEVRMDMQLRLPER